jgi:hypothetical protein
MKDADQLPITHTSLEYKPCIKSDEKSMQPGEKSYPLEIDGHLNCTFDPSLNRTYDDRYQEVPNFVVN